MSIFYLLTFIICGAYVALMIYYLIGWAKANERATNNEQSTTKVSVVVPVRNEEANILKIISCLQKQTYTHFEIVVVDDHSTDKTIDLLRKNNFSNFTLIQLDEKQLGKKSAIAEGIKNATGNLIITTDADCEMGENWLTTIVSFYEVEKPKMIVAPVLIAGEKSFFEILQSQEIIALTASACGSLYFNLPFLCSGANLIFEKDAFHLANGFENADSTLTGDDIFLMLKFQKRFGTKKIKYLKSKDAAVYTSTEENFSSVILQRKRWASKTFLYGFSYITAVAILIFVTNFLIFVSVPIAIGISLINVKFAFALIITLPLKCIVDYMLIQSASSFFGKKFSPLVFIFGSLVYPFYVSVLGLISPFTNYSWKGRKS